MRLVLNTLISSLCFLSCLTTLVSQETLEQTIMHDGIEREYILYVPPSYDGSVNVPLVFNFHGYTSTAAQQMFYGDFRNIADRENFIIAHPMGTIGTDGEPFLNAQWIEGGPDDIGFTSALIDSISTSWNINLNRVYSTGMSNGGFMSYTLACELSGKIAAIASVTGSMTIPQLDETCDPENLTPIMEIHGTSDLVVPYEGNNWMAPIESVLDFWISESQCDQNPVFTNIENSNTTDGSTVEHYIYKNGLEGHEIEHYKIIDGGHTWPGAIFGSSNKDINASELIWEFFSKYDLNGRLSTHNENVVIENKLTIYPNPSNGIIELETNNSILIDKVSILDQNGKLVFYNEPFQKSTTLDLHLDKGFYFLKAESNQEVIIHKIIIQ